MIPLDVVSGGFDMVCNGRRVVIFNEGLEVFSFSIMKSSFCFALLSTSRLFFRIIAASNLSFDTRTA